MTSALSNNLTLYRYRRNNKCLHENLGEGIRLTLMLIPGGEFLMGAPEDEPKSNSTERPRRLVKLKSFLMGRYPITQEQWRVVAGYEEIKRSLDRDPSAFKGENRPVESVSWEEAVEFCERLSEKTGRSYRLPSEAEWEYACRAETQTPFHYGAMITDKLGNYYGQATYNGSPKGDYGGETTEVGSFPGNRWGLCDMHGNVWEWCEDDWHESYEDAPKDGSAWLEARETRRSKLLRGGSWLNYPEYCRSAYRSSGTRGNRDDNFGFRVCCEVPRTFS